MPWPAATAPKPSTMIRVMLGMISRKVQKRALSRTRSIDVSYSFWLRAVELVEDPAGAAERLDHPQSVGALLDCGRDVARLVLDQPRQPGVFLLVVQAGPGDRHDRGDDDQPEWPVHVQQQRGDQQDLDDVHHDEQQPEAEEPADGGQVAHHPATAADRIASGRGRPSAAAGAWHTCPAGCRSRCRPCRPRRSSGAERSAAPPAHRVRWRAGRAPTAPDDPSRDRAVDHRLGHQWDDHRHADPEKPEQHHQDEPSPVRPHVRPHPPQRRAVRRFARIAVPVVPDPGRRRDQGRPVQRAGLERLLGSHARARRARPIRSGAIRSGAGRHVGGHTDRSSGC